MTHIFNLPPHALSAIAGRLIPPPGATAPVFSYAPYAERLLSVEEKTQHAGRDLARKKLFLAGIDEKHGIGNRELFYIVDNAYSPAERRSYVTQKITHLANQQNRSNSDIVADIEKALAGEIHIGLDLTKIRNFSVRIPILQLLETMSFISLDLQTRDRIVPGNHIAGNFGKIIGNSPHLAYLRLNHGGSPSHLLSCDLSRELENLHCVADLDFAGSRMQIDSAIGLLTGGLKVRRLGLAYIRVTEGDSYRILNETDATRLACALETNTQLEQLDLSENYEIGSRGIEALAKSIASNPASVLKQVNFYGTEMGDDGAIILADVIRSNSTIQDMNLSGNGITDTGATALADAIKSNSTLQYLDLRGNDITNAGATTLWCALAHNSTIKRVDLQYRQNDEPIAQN